MDPLTHQTTKLKFYDQLQQLQLQLQQLRSAAC